MEDQQIKIDQYLLDQMTQEEKNNFEKEMKANQQLAKEVAAQRDALALMEISRDSKMKATLQAMHQDIVKEPAKVVPLKTNRWKALAWAGAAAILLLLVAQFMFQQNADPQQLFAANFETYELSFSSRGYDVDQAFVEAGDAYHTGNYQEALNQILTIEERRPSSLLQLAKGLCLLELGEAQDAITTFQNLVTDPLYAEPAQWYMALAYLKQGNTTQCKTLLQKIPPTAEFYDEAIKLLKDLK